jgi:TraU protein
LQPYYLSFADAFFWRSGYPITDGPISGSDHTIQVMNPFQNQLGSGLENWGSMYPREGTLDQSHDAKTASVLAWRAMDVLRNDVRVGGGGHRVGVPLPANYRNKSYYWQMIYPEVKSCVRRPYYTTTDITKDFMEPNEFGGYAWNIYTRYECCMNTSGRKIGEIPLPTPICLSLSI